MLKKSILFSLLLLPGLGWALPDSTQVTALFNRGFQKVYTDPDSAFFLIRQALQQSQDIDFHQGYASSLNVLGIIHDVESRPDSSLLYYRRALSVAQKNHLARIEAQIYNNIGLIHWNGALPDSAVYYYQQSAKIFREKADKRGLANSYNNVGLIYFDESLFEKSLRYHKDALKLRIEIGNDYGIGASWNNIGLCYQDLGLLDSAETCYQKAVVSREKAKDEYGLSKTFTNLGTLYGKLQQPALASDYNTKALALKKKLNDDQGYVSTAFNLANMYFHYLDQDQKALDLVKEIGPMAEKSEFKKLLWKIYDLRAQLASKAGRMEEAYNFQRKAFEISRALEREGLREELAELQTRFDSEKQAHEIELLTKQNAIRELEFQQKDLLVNQQRNQIILLVLALVLLTILGFYSFERRRQKRERAHQKELIEMQELGLSAVLQTQENERRRIAGELHDGIGQLLVGLRMMMNRLANDLGELPEKQSTLLNRSTQVLDEACTEVRGISHQMMPKTLSEVGLVPAVGDLLEKTVSLSGINYKFESSGLESRFSENLEVGVYRIFQEVLSNIIKHAKASNLTVDLSKEGNLLQLTVSDDGKGFDPKKTKGKGLGLTNMLTRARAMQGTINFERGPQAGMIFTLSAPLG